MSAVPALCLALTLFLCATSCCCEAFRGDASPVCQEEAGLSVVVAQKRDTAVLLLLSVHYKRHLSSSEKITELSTQD